MPKENNDTGKQSSRDEIIIKLHEDPRIQSFQHRLPALENHQHNHHVAKVPRKS